MKKWLVGFFVIFLVAWIAILFLVPAKLQVSRMVSMHCTTNGAYRSFSEENNWEKWWPTNGRLETAKQPMSVNTFIFNGDSIHITKKLRNTLEIQISSKTLNTPSSVIFIPTGPDSVIIEWRCELVSGWNPVQKIINYRRAVRIKENMTLLLERLRKFIEQPENIYGIPMRESSTKDTLLITAKYVSTVYPDTRTIYRYLSPLKDYILLNGAHETGSPMLNVTPLATNQFQIMVGLPIDKKLAENGNIAPRRMIPGRFIVAEVKGGEYTVVQALRQLKLYFEDYEKTSMAIPFQSLVTDRMLETDTAKWITRIYAPVFH